jgi:hypothetical protein
MKSSFGEVAVAVLIAGAMAAVAALAGFAAGAIVPALLLSGEGSYSGLLFAPLTAIVLGVLVFVIAFRKIISYGNSEDE